MGLHSGTHSKLAVIGGIFTIAIADSFSDALGIHISEESGNVHTKKHIWESTIVTFLAKFIFALTFLVPIIFFDILEATIICVVWGIGVLTVISYKLSKAQGERPFKIISEHILIALVVIIATHFAGVFIYSIPLDKPDLLTSQWYNLCVAFSLFNLILKGETFFYIL